MTKLMLFMSSSSAALYLLLRLMSILMSIGKKPPRNEIGSKASKSTKSKEDATTATKKSYLWGFMFALLFYYGFPIWWWRYGLRRAMYLVVACIAAGAVLQIIMRTYGFIEVNGLAESLMFGFLFSVPVRAFSWLLGGMAR